VAAFRRNRWPLCLGFRKREEKVSLQTRDPAEAKVRHAKALAELEARWANLRAGPKPLTEREAHQLAIVSYDRWLEQYRDNPSQQTNWDIGVGDRLFGPPPTREEKGAARAQSVDFLSPEPELYKVARMEQACLEAADGYLSAHGFSEDWQNRQTMARAIGAAIQRASLVLAKLAKGETVSEFPFPKLSVSPGASVAHSPGRAVTFQDLLDGWAAERRPVAKTVYEWSRVIRELEKYLGHTDAHRLTAENLVDWKRALVAAGLRAKTIQGSKLSPVRAILQWGVQNKLLSSNAAEGVSLDVKAKQGERKRSFASPAINRVGSGGRPGSSVYTSPNRSSRKLQSTASTITLISPDLGSTRYTLCFSCSGSALMPS
jgi:hypothetical protein